MMTTKRLTAWAMAFAVAPLVLIGQKSIIENHVISGGGGKSSGGDHSVSGTIGQAIGGGAASGGLYELKSGFHATLEVIPAEPDESFQAWMNGLSDEDKPPEGQRGPLDQPAGDGMSNLLKYALGLMPMSPSADAAPKVVVVPMMDGNVERDYLGIELERSVEAAVVFEVENSGDLGGWQTARFRTEIIDPAAGENRERVQLITDIPVEDHQKHFLRLLLQEEPP